MFKPSIGFALTWYSVALLPANALPPSTLAPPAAFPELIVLSRSGAYAILAVIPKGNKSPGVWNCTLLYESIVKLSLVP
jgi:hypothetical protein